MAKVMDKLIAYRVPKDIDKRLSELAKRTHRTKTFYARQALLEKLEEFEDYYEAIQVLERNEKTHSQAEVERMIDDMDD